MRKPIPLTRIYKRTACGRAVYGCPCPAANCDGTCAAAGVLVCCFGMSDSPWTRAVDAVRDLSDDGAIMAAAAIALTYGIEQDAVLPLAVRRIVGGDPADVVERLLGIVKAGDRQDGTAVDGCVVVSHKGGPRNAVPGYELWACVVRPNECGHWVGVVRAGPHVWMAVNFTTPDGECDTKILDDRDDDMLITNPPGLHFYYLQTQYRP